MSIIKFQSDGSVHNCMMKRVSSHIVELTLNENIDSITVSSGFVILNENNFSIQGNYTDYTTIYQSYEDNNKYYKLSNDGSVYVEPEPVPEPQPYVPTSEELAEQERLEQIRQLQSNIDCLKNQLNSSDYKIIKAYEYSMVDKESEYDMEELHEERQGIRNQINILENELNILYGIADDTGISIENNGVEDSVLNDE